jgi:ParB/RepB/Spo0J family partition protein
MPLQEKMMNSSVINLKTHQIQISPDANPNRMDPERFELLKRAITRMGFLQPILVRWDAARKPDAGYVIVDGHHRYRAACELRLAEVPCFVRDATTDNDARVLQIGMNQLRGEVDLGIVATTLLDLQNNGWSINDLEIVGLNASEITDLIGAVQPVDSLLDQQVTLPPMEAPAAVRTKPYTLEINFTDREAFTKAKKGLRKAAGKGGDMAAGLLRLLGDAPEGE